MFIFETSLQDEAFLDLWHRQDQIIDVSDFTYSQFEQDKPEGPSHLLREHIWLRRLLDSILGLIRKPICHESAGIVPIIDLQYIEIICDYINTVFS